VSAADGAEPIAPAELRSLFADLTHHPVLVLAVSGGPDSTALMWVAARWRKALKQGPKLVAVTIDHGLRKEARHEAASVKRLARTLGVAHRTMRWQGRKPATGLQEAARLERYRLLAAAAKDLGAHAIVTAHTLDDQAETVLIRLTRGSGISGLAAMARISSLPGGDSEVSLVRPLLNIPKARLLATLRRARIPYADDPSNRDPRFTRARLRASMPALAREGLKAERLVSLARRARRADEALEAAAGEAWAELAPGPWAKEGPFELPVLRYVQLPAELSLRLLGRAIAAAGDEGPVELGKLEALHEALAASPAGVRFRRTLAGAVVSRDEDRLRIDRAPARRSAAAAKRP
jgi:tRNA(Ile)-lysidine synthase